MGEKNNLNKLARAIMIAMFFMVTFNSTAAMAAAVDLYYFKGRVGRDNYHVFVKTSEEVIVGTTAAGAAVTYSPIYKEAPAAKLSGRIFVIVDENVLLLAVR